MNGDPDGSQTSRLLTIQGSQGLTRVRLPFAEQVEDEVAAGDTLSLVLPKEQSLTVAREYREGSRRAPAGWGGLVLLDPPRGCLWGAAPRAGAEGQDLIILP